ncbi:unnamed protein product [Haemonchus placei]|uniref:Uncharacterized protein n=1 Tax=Haemonchus placei TaxID=6290 RepID=A0A0N4WB96_HAEPC|nr:unnamed protein product [Haemonchus placei]
MLLYVFPCADFKFAFQISARQFSERSYDTSQGWRFMDKTLVFQIFTDRSIAFNAIQYIMYKVNYGFSYSFIFTHFKGLFIMEYRLKKFKRDVFVLSGHRALSPTLPRPPFETAYFGHISS